MGSHNEGRCVPPARDRAKSMRNHKPRGRRHPDKEPRAILISKQLELPNGEVRHAEGDEFFLFAPKGTGRAAIDRAIRDYVKDRAAAQAFGS